MDALYHHLTLGNLPESNILITKFAHCSLDQVPYIEDCIIELSSNAIAQARVF